MDSEELYYEHYERIAEALAKIDYTMQNNAIHGIVVFVDEAPSNWEEEIEKALRTIGISVDDDMNEWSSLCEEANTVYTTFVPID